MVRMELSRIVFSENSDQQIIFLKEANGKRGFPIVIGNFEARQIYDNVKQIKYPRPLTHDLIENIMNSFKISLSRIEITELKNNTFYARLIMKMNGQEMPVDARPSDAIVMATKLGVPIDVHEEILAGFADPLPE